MSKIHSIVTTSHANTTNVPLPTLHIPDLDSPDPQATAHMHEYDQADPSGSQRSTTVEISPFPYISQRRKLVRSLGNSPWRRKPSSDLDSDMAFKTSKSTASHGARRLDGNTPSTHASLTNGATSPHVLPSPSPEAMPEFDAKRTYSKSQLTPSLSSTVAAAAIIGVAPKRSGEDISIVNLSKYPGSERTSLQPHLILAYDSSASTLTSAKTLHYLRAQAIHICTQALHLVVLLNNVTLSSENEADLNVAVLELQDELIELSCKVHDWSAYTCVDAAKATEELDTQYDTFFRKRNLIDGFRNRSRDIMWRRMRSIDNKRIEADIHNVS